MKFELDDENINSKVARSMREAIRSAKDCNFTDIYVRADGEYKIFEADWLKYLKITEPHRSEVYQQPMTENQRRYEDAFSQAARQNERLK